MYDFSKAITKNKKTATEDLKLKIETCDEQYCTKLEGEIEEAPENETSIPFASIAFTVTAAVLTTTLAFVYPTIGPYFILGGLFVWAITVGISCSPALPIQRMTNDGRK